MKKLLTLLVSTVLCISLNVHAESKGKVLVVMSNADKIKLKNGKTLLTGFYLNEFAIPVQEMLDAGYEVVVATPQGKKPVMDKGSKNAQFFGDDKKKLDEAVKLADRVLVKKNIAKLQTVADGNLNEYVGLYIPGGHAPIGDLMVDVNLGKILKEFHDKGKTTALMCHGPIAVISSVDNPATFRKMMIAGDHDGAEKIASDWIYKDYKMTIFSNEEEKDVEKNHINGNLEFYVEDALKVAGAKVENKGPNESNVVEDRELITGQNPSSDHELGKAMVNSMDKNSKK